MDVLSDVIGIMRTGRPRAARVLWHAPWGQRFPSALGSAGFQVILQGSCWLIPPDAGAPPVALGTGDVVLFPHGHGYALADAPTTPLDEPHCDPLDEADLYVSTSIGDPSRGDSTMTLCGGYRLDPTRAHPLLQGLPDLVHIPARLGRRDQLRAAVDLLAGEIDHPRLGTDTIVPTLLDTLLHYVLRAWFEENPHRGAGTGWAAALADPAISAALHAIHRAPARPWTVASLAAEAGLSRAAFAKRFSGMVGQPPLTYLTWWRMTTAARLLHTSDTPLAQVASQTGYSSEFAFANAFKREYGTAPGRYRKQPPAQSLPRRVPLRRSSGSSARRS
ncbi:AraC family transcriptional regulator [Actinomadura oligospora]|uniref:AraC family transcriptional regulator n=1 Tax=Actinomadura oligospora TaxID=111804 RepID=UPI0004B98AA0|nr:AraC family transcriptional regulator [Actinomadura oligospora]